MSRLSGLGHRLYSGQASIDIVGRRRTWYIVSGIIIALAIGSLLFRGLNLGIEFRGGGDYTIPNATCSVEQARAVAEAKTGSQAIVTVSGQGTVRVQTEALTTTESAELAKSLSTTCGVGVDTIKVQVVGPTWGSEISKKALQGLIVFLILVALFMSIYFEWRMAVAGLIALAHDLIITVGLYSLFGLEVTPATVIGILTILGYSLYDTVVVFDKVKENTRNITGQSVLTYSDAANLAVNQTLVRSINTSIVALLPVLAIIIVGAGLLGAGTLLDLAVALAIGMAAGAYSSIFVATPFLAQLKEKQPQMVALATRVRARRANAARSGASSESSTDAAARTTTLVDSAPRQQPKRVPRSKRPKK
ncbi:MAG: protein translocase subunit SecF [Candidatus Nanopelagicales bacterium]|nr:protein translocase subunit SecF [Candidatus Nanopelagicales bacterium]